MYSRQPHIISLETGGDIVSGADSLLKKLGFKSGLPELHLRTTSLKKYGYCGPGTRLEKRLDDNGNPKPGSEPINKIDEVCMHLDYNYKLADEGKGTRAEADKKMIEEELNQLPNKDLNWNEKLAKYFTRGVIGFKHKLGLGIEAEELLEPIRYKFIECLSTT